MPMVDPGGRGKDAGLMGSVVDRLGDLGGLGGAKGAHAVRQARV
jgi:hypothetical protein